MRNFCYYILLRVRCIRNNCDELRPVYAQRYLVYIIILLSMNFTYIYMLLVSAKKRQIGAYGK